MKIILTETQFKRVILKVGDPPDTSEKTIIQNTKNKLSTAMENLRDFFSKLLSIEVELRGVQNKGQMGKSDISKNYNKISNLIEKLNEVIKNPSLATRLTHSGLSKWMVDEINTVLNDIVITYKPLKKHSINFDEFINNVRGGDKYLMTNNILDNKNCCKPKDVKSFNNSVNSFIRQLTDANDKIDSKPISESHVDSKGVNYVKDIDKSSSDNEDLCDELTINSVEELKDKMRGMDISKDDRKKITVIIKKMKRDFNYLSADLDVANTYLRHIQNIICTYSKEDIKNID